MRIGFFGHHEQIIQFFSNLRLVRQSQGIVGCTASRYVVYHGVFNADFGYIHLHGGFHDSSARLIVLGLHLTLVWVAGLSGTGAENRTKCVNIIYIYADGIFHIVVFQSITERGDFVCRVFLYPFITSTQIILEFPHHTRTTSFPSMSSTNLQSYRHFILKFCSFDCLILVCIGDGRTCIKGVVVGMFVLFQFSTIFEGLHFSLFV